MIPHKTTVNGAVITIEGVHISMLNDVVAYLDLEQFSVLRGTGEDIDTWIISAPINSVMQKEYAGMIHRANNENKLGKKVDTGKGKPDNDPTPPGRGGGAKVTEFINTEAKAA